MKVLKMFGDILCGVGNVVRWFPIVWKDRQWDYRFLLGMLRFKLGLMEKFFQEDAMYVSAKDDASAIKSCCCVLDRLLADEYDTVAFEAHDKKWGTLKMETDLDSGTLNMSRPNVKTEQDRVQERQEFLDCCRDEDNMRLYDVNTLFTLLRRNIQSWWD